MDNLFDMACPQCGHSDELDIAATVWVRLTADGTDESESEIGDHVWDDDSPCSCAHCGWTGTVLNASPESEPDKQALLQRLLPYVADDDDGLSLEEFARLVADRVKEDSEDEEGPAP